MVKNFIHAIIFATFGFTCIFSTYAILIEIPQNAGNPDVVVTWPAQIDESTASESTLFDLIQIINTYLRFSIGVVAMGVLIYWWIKLITGQGDPAKMKEANKLLMWALIGILVAIFSYALVRLIINIL